MASARSAAGGEAGQLSSGDGEESGRLSSVDGEEATREASPGVLQVPLHILSASFLCLSAWLAGRRPGSLWAGELLLVSGVLFGAAAALGVDRVWRSGDPGRRRGLDELLGGATGYALLYVGAVLFAAAEAYAAGRAFDEGAPVLALALLFPPVALAGYALRRAAARESFAGPTGRASSSAPESEGVETRVGEEGQRE